MQHDDLQPLPDEEALAERGRILVARAVAETRAPLALRERIERDRAAVGRRAAAPGRRRLWPFALTAGALAAVLLVAVLAGVGSIGGGSGGSGGPTVLGVVRVALGGPQSPAPAPTGDGFVDAFVKPVRFPDWRPLSWPATGERVDRVAGRPVRTVFYRGPSGAVAAYSIVGGKPLEHPDGAREVAVDGTTYHVTEVDGARVVTWEEGGRTCIIRAPGSVPADRLVALASWTPS